LHTEPLKMSYLIKWVCTLVLVTCCGKSK
jgi:hypothetical protein